MLARCFTFRIKMQKLFAFIGTCRLTLRDIDLDSDSDVIVGETLIVR